MCSLYVFPVEMNNFLSNICCKEWKGSLIITLSWDCFTRQCFRVSNVTKPSKRKEQKHNKMHSSDLWTTMWQSSHGNLVNWLWEDQADFFPAALATTEKAIKSIHQKASVSRAIHSEAREEKYHQYLTLFYGEATWFHPMTPEMTTSNQLQSSKIVCISYFERLAAVAILFTHILARPWPFHHKQCSNVVWAFWERCRSAQDLCLRKCVTVMSAVTAGPCEATTTVICGCGRLMKWSACHPASFARSIRWRAGAACFMNDGDLLRPSIYLSLRVTAGPLCTRRQGSGHPSCSQHNTLLQAGCINTNCWERQKIVNDFVISSWKRSERPLRYIPTHAVKADRPLRW